MRRRTRSFVIGAPLVLWAGAQALAQATGSAVSPSTCPADAPRDISVKLDEVRGFRVVRSKGRGALGEGMTAEVVLVGEAAMADTWPTSYRLRVAIPQMLLSRAEPGRPKYDDGTILYTLADTTRFALSGASYATATTPPVGGFPGAFEEILTYPISADQIRILASAKLLKMNAGDDRLPINAGKLIRGARGIAALLGCGP